MVDLALIREALLDPEIAAYPDFTQAVSDVCDQLERFRSERAYIVGCNDGFEVGIDQAASLIEEKIIMDTSSGKVLTPRQDGNRDGLHYAMIIRQLTRAPIFTGGTVQSGGDHGR
ncbi:hypothetical protein [Shinella sp.]|jgi:hypothetical protein|uniref:hypothetical protein n=1 Tax=Shinella sp. TaxID=1870904 RepID=UPI003F6F3A22